MQADVIQNHENVNFRNNAQGETQQRKYKSIKHGGGQVYDHSSVKAVVISTGIYKF
jgi:hypothetical protein